MKFPVRALLTAALALPLLPAGALPVVTVTRDDTVLTQSCEVVIPPGTVIVDANTNGVLHVGRDDITVRFVSRSELRGAEANTPGDALRGIGIRIDGHRNVRLVGARVQGFFNGLVATHADGLTIDGGDFSGNYRQRLRSTSAAEDAADWLFPHHNDEQKWRDEYGGAVCLESSSRVIIRHVRVRRGQNGILLDRVNESQIYDNDCSFLSGWGLALWRSSSNIVSRNAFDFCVRGHVEGVYNRGQDSAGILCFEQSSDNVFAENSATHGGDGFFGFAGREALGEGWLEAERNRLRRATGRTEVDDLVRVPPEVAREFSARGCNRNLLLGNDFSYAPAHGIEITFSEGNVLARNRLVENAICGIWGGYSSGTLIAENEIAGNGGMAYGLERGGINMEHASSNRIVGNVFRDNKCAIHLWWDDDGALLKSPGVAGNDLGVTGNIIAKNTFSIGTNPPFRGLRPDERLVVLQLRDHGPLHVRDTAYVGNRVTLAASNAVEFALDRGLELVTNLATPSLRLPHPTILGRSRTVGARSKLRGRDQIILDEWGPWDHEGPLVRNAGTASGNARFEIFGLPDPPTIDVQSGQVSPAVTRTPAGPWLLTLVAPPGVTPYSVHLTAPGWNHTLHGTLLAATWDVTFFPWSIDPRENLAAWRQLADGPQAVHTRAPRLDFPYGGGGPRQLNLPGLDANRLPGSDHFGMIARTRLQLPAGRWRLVTRSDDGVRVRVDGRTVLENWTWHGPTRDEAVFTQAAAGEITLEVEHFEIDGYAVLSFDLEPDGL